MTKIFMDTEFTGLHQKTTLISLALISDCGKSFYAEFTDFDINQLDDWLKENVIKNLLFFDSEDINLWKAQDRKRVENYIPSITLTGDLDNLRCFGNTLAIESELRNWLSQFNCRCAGSCDCSKIEIWSDCLSYDWVLFNNIFGNAFDLPEYINYIPFDISTYFKIENIDPDINREEFVSKYKDLSSFDSFGRELMKTLDKGKHNALWDSFIIKCCYEILENFNGRTLGCSIQQFGVEK